MSKLVKKVGKVFKKVGKFVLKVAPYALAAAAVVFTGGAALGLGFAAGGFSAAVGGVVTSLGIGGAVGGALTGAITGAGMGAAVGGILGGKKGLKQGFLTGALTGGVLGAVSPGSVGVVKNAAGKWVTSQGIKNAAAVAAKSAPLTSVGPSFANATLPGVPTELSPMNLPNALGGGSSVVGANGGLNAGGALGTAPAVTAPTASPAALAQLGPPSTVSTSITAAPAPTVAAPTVAAPSVTSQIAGQMAAAPQAGTGIGGFLQANPGLAGNLLQSVGGVLSGGDESAADIAAARAEAEKDMGQFAYGGAYTGGNAAAPFGVQNYAPPVPRPGRWYVNPATNKVEEIPV